MSKKQKSFGFFKHQNRKNFLKVFLGMLSVKDLTYYVVRSESFWKELPQKDWIPEIIRLTKSEKRDGSNCLVKLLMKKGKLELMDVYNRFSMNPQKNISKKSCVLELVTKLYGGKSPIEKRNSEKRYYQNYVKSDSGHVVVSGILVPKEIVSLILSFLPRDYETIIEVGSLVKNIYIELLLSYCPIHVSKDNIFSISVLSLMNTSRIRICDLINNEMNYILQKLGRRLQVIDISRSPKNPDPPSLMKLVDLLVKYRKTKKIDNYPLRNVREICTNGIMGDFNWEEEEEEDSDGDEEKISFKSRRRRRNVSLFKRQRKGKDVSKLMDYVFPNLESLRCLGVNFSGKLLTTTSKLKRIGFNLTDKHIFGHFYHFHFRALKLSFSELLRSKSNKIHFDKITSLEISRVYFNFSYDPKELMAVLKHFKNLSELRIQFDTHIQNDNHDHSYNSFSFHPFNSEVVPSLKKLCIEDKFFEHKSNFFKPVEMYWEVVDLFHRIRVPKKLKKLENLEELVIKSYMENCRHYYEIIDFNVQDVVCHLMFENIYFPNLHTFRGVLPLLRREEGFYSTEKKNHDQQKWTDSVDVIQQLVEFVSDKTMFLEQFRFFELKIQATAWRFHEEEVVIRLQHLDVSQRRRLTVKYDTFERRKEVLCDDEQKIVVSTSKMKNTNPIPSKKLKRGWKRKKNLVQIVEKVKRPLVIFFHLLLEEVVSGRKIVEDLCVNMIRFQVPDQSRELWKSLIREKVDFFLEECDDHLKESFRFDESILEITVQ